MATTANRNLNYNKRLYFVLLPLCSIAVFLIANLSPYLNPCFHSKVDDVSFNETFEDRLDQLDQEDARLIQYTRIRHLTPPSKLPYNFTASAGTTPDEYSKWVAQFFRNKQNGTFIEAGAYNGVSNSHTLYLEKMLGWKGLLVECSPFLVPSVKMARRKAWVADVCLSVTKKPATMQFAIPSNFPGSGRIGGPLGTLLPKDVTWSYVDVPVIPLYTLLAALGWKDIDYFSFDIQGQELNVLKTFAFDKVRFKVLILEINLHKPDAQQELHELLLKNGYVRVKRLEYDDIYVHEEFKNMIP